MTGDSLANIRDLACRLIGDAMQHPVEAISMTPGWWRMYQ